MIDGLRSLVPTPSTEDIFAERIRIELGSVTYTLPVRSRKANREWREALDGEFATMMQRLERMKSSSLVLGALVGASDKLLDALIAYDATGVLPARDAIDDEASEMQIVRALLNVWMMANPLVAIGLVLTRSDDEPPAAAPIPSPESSPTPPGPSAGARATSRKS